MIKKAIRDLHSTKPVQTRFCDVIVDDNGIYLENKTTDKKDIKHFNRIQWEDVVAQVEEAKRERSSLMKTSE